MSLAWVLGGGGLVGRSLCKVLQAGGTRLFRPERPLCWQDPGELALQLRAGARAFAATAAGHPEWSLYWAAGQGTMSSTAPALQPEGEALRILLEAIHAEPALRDCPGRIALVSSAGAIYAGSRDDIVDELSVIAPTTPYAQAKLEQEGLVQAYLRDTPQHSGLIARCSTLYGVGQARGKPQGLLTFIARNLLRNLPISIFVPFDTVRDYLSADDAANQIVVQLAQCPAPGSAQVRIVASEEPVTIAEIVAVFRRVSRRNLRIVTTASPLAGHYSRRLRFRSRFAPAGAVPARTPLAVGVARLLQAERLALAGAPSGPGR